MHMLIAATNEIELTLDAAESGESVQWRVPKNAVVGDDCVLCHWRGIYATALVQTDPAPSPQRTGYYVSDIGEIDLLGQLLPLEVVAERLPDWKWLTYPRSYTTVPEEFESELWDLLSLFQEPKPLEVADEVSFEGAAAVRLHIVRERDSEIVERKKAAVIAATGTLKCEVCNFDFGHRYGKLGEGYCEVRHLNPISARKDSTATHLDELAVVCSNCHRMLHRHGLLAIDDLRQRLVRSLENS